MAKEDLIRYGGGSGFIVEPGYVLTNKHVVEGSDFIEVVKGERSFSAELIAQSPTADLAILKCAEFKVRSLHLATEVPRLGTEVAVLGYPEVGKLGTTMKATRGAVSGLPSPGFEDKLLFDAIINHGNSGGPVCDSKGRVVAVATWGLTLKLGNLYGGIPSALSAEFVRKHISVRGSSTPALKDAAWPDVIAAADPSIVRIQVYQRASSLRLARKISDSSNLWEDLWCMACYGSRALTCPNRKCLKGRIRTFRGSFPVRFILVPCETCNGAAQIECKHCVRGIDPAVAPAAHKR